MATAIAGASAATNDAWPTVPLYPSSSFPAMNQTRPVTPPPAKTQSTQKPAAADPTPAITKVAALKETGTVTNSSSSTNASDNANLDDSHHLEPGDVISFKIQEDEKDTYAEKKDAAHLTVTDSSEVDFPYVGRVSVADETCDQVATKVKALLEKDYYYRATVVIGVDSINKVRGQAFVCGLVRTQGSVDILFNHDLTAGEAILMMGGLADFADKKDVKIIRNHDEGGTTNQQVFVVNMEQVLEKGQIEKDIVLQPGDFVIVPARVLNF